MKKVWAVACSPIGVLSGCFSIWLVGFIVIGPAYYGPVPGWAWVAFLIVSVYSILCFVVARRLWRSDKK